MNRANQFLSSLKVVMGNMASFLKDHELMPTEAGAISNLCAGEEEEVEEEKSAEENSHSSQEEGKVYRDSGFESELEAREREQESPGSNPFPMQKLVSSSVPKSVSSESSQHTSKQSENDALNSYSSKCSSFEPEVMEFHKKSEEDSEELNDRDFDHVEEKAETILEEHEELVEIEIMPTCGKSDEIMEVFDSFSLKLKNVDDSNLKGEMVESSQGKDILETDAPLDHSNSESGEDQILSSRSNLSSHSASSEIARPKSNYYRPLSPVSPDVSIISSALHAKPPPSISSPVSNLSATISSSLHQKSTTDTEASRTNVSLTVVSSNPERLPSPAISSPTSHSHSKSSPLVSSFAQSLNSSTEIPVECAHNTIHRPRKHPSFHKSISDSEVSRFHNPKELQRTNSTTSDKKVQSAISPKYEDSKKLDVGELFKLCNGQKQGVVTEKVSLHQIFNLCNGQKQELSKDACLQTKEDLQKKHASSGVHQEEFQKYLELGKFIRNLGMFLCVQISVQKWPSSET